MIILILIWLNDQSFLKIPTPKAKLNYITFLYYWWQLLENSHHLY